MFTLNSRREERNWFKDTNLHSSMHKKKLKQKDKDKDEYFKQRERRHSRIRGRY